MPFEKGHNKSKGRPKGSPNKATKKRREFISKLLDDQEDEIKKALEKLRKDSPKDYLNIIATLMEYDTAKLSRVELTGGDEDDKPVTINIKPASEL